MMPSSKKVGNTSVLSPTKNRRSSRNNKDKDRVGKESSHERNKSEKRLKSVINVVPGSKEQPLALPGYDNEPPLLERQSSKEPGHSSSSRSYKSSSSSKSSHTAPNPASVQGQSGLSVDIAKLLQEQTVLLRELKNKSSPSRQSSPNPIVSQISAPSIPVTTNPTLVTQTQPSDLQAGHSDQSQVQEELELDDGLVAAINASLVENKNLGENLDPSSCPVY